MLFNIKKFFHLQKTYQKLCFKPINYQYHKDFTQNSHSAIIDNKKIQTIKYYFFEHNREKTEILSPPYISQNIL